MQRCLKSDAQAQKQFYDRFAKRMLGVCYRYVQNTPEAEDILQEGYIRAFRYLKDFRSEGSLEGWLRRIMVTTSINFLKSQKNFRTEIELDAASGQPGEANQILQRMENQEVMKLIQQLSPGYRTVLNLFAIEGYSHREIGDLLGIGESTSRSQYTRAKQLLQKKIEDHFSFGIHHGRSEQGK